MKIYGGFCPAQLTPDCTPARASAIGRSIQATSSLEIGRPQAFEPRNRLARQRAFFDGRDGLFELHKFRDADHARGHVAVAKHKAQRGLCRRAMAVTDHLADQIGAMHFIVDVSPGRKHCKFFRSRGTRQRAAGPDPDIENSHVLVETFPDDAREVLHRPDLWRARPGGARVDGVVVDLRAVKAAAFDDFEASRRFACRRNAGCREQTLRLETIEYVGNATGAQHLMDRQLRPAADGGAELIVQLKQRNAVRAQPFEALLQAALDRAADVHKVVGHYEDLGGDVWTWLKRGQVTTNRLLGGAATVERRRVDQVDSCLDGAHQRADPRRFIRLDQDAAGNARSESNLGNLKARTAKPILSHRATKCPRLRCA